MRVQCLHICYMIYTLSWLNTLKRFFSLHWLHVLRVIGSFNMQVWQPAELCVQDWRGIRNSLCRYAHNFHGGVSFRGIWWSFAFGVRYLWRHNSTSYSCFQTNVLAKFFDTICIFFYIHSPYFIALNINYHRSKLGYRRKLHSTLRHNNS